MINPLLLLVRTGGSSLIPVFEQMLTDIFSKEKLKQFETFTSIAAELSLIKTPEDLLLSQ